MTAAATKDFPAVVRRKVDAILLDKHRQVIRDPKGKYTDLIVLEACAYLMEFGDWNDVVEAALVARAIAAELEVLVAVNQIGQRASIKTAILVLAVWGVVAILHTLWGAL